MNENVISIISACCGSFMSLCTVYPTEVYKRALHLNTHKPTIQRLSSYSIFRSLFPFGLYKGFSSCAIGTVPKNAFPLFAYPKVHNYFSNKIGKDNALSSLLTGMTLTCFVTSFSAPTENLSLRRSNFPYESSFSYLKNGGYRNLYTGLSGFLMMDFIRVGIKFMMYSEILKCVKPYTQNSNIQWLPQALSGAASSSLVALFTNPIDVAHTKFRSDYTHELYQKSFTKALFSTKLSDLYCGFLVRALRGIPGGFVMFGITEFMKNKLTI